MYFGVEGEGLKKVVIGAFKFVYYWILLTLFTDV